MQRLLMDSSLPTLFLYPLLNAEAKQWWYHVQLRENENTNEARRLERNNIRSMLETLREACRHNGYLIILDQESAVDPRWILYATRHHYWSGYGADTSLFVQALKLCRVPLFYYSQVSTEISEQLRSALEG